VHPKSIQFAVAATNQNEGGRVVLSDSQIRLRLTTVYARLQIIYLAYDWSQPWRTGSLHSGLSSDETRSVDIKSDDMR